MKNIIIIFSCLSVIFVSGCKPEPVIDQGAIKWGEFLRGQTLPTVDTSSLGNYIEGYIDGQRFCFREDKDSIFIYDAGSSIFYANLPDTSVFKPSSYGASWTFSQRESFSDWYFSIDFYYPNFKLNYDGNDSSRLVQYRLDRVKTTSATIGNHFEYKDYSFFFDIKKRIPPVAPGVGSAKSERLYVSHCNQSNSYMKVVSVRQLGYIPDARYSNRREVIYEFEANIGYFGLIYKRITKGRIRIYI